MPSKRKIVGVIGSGSHRHEALSVPLGKWLAEQGYHLINGGGTGAMEATAKAFSETEIRTGLTLGVLPSRYICDTPQNRKTFQSPIGYPNQYVDLPIRTHLHLSGLQGMENFSRNHIIILTADIVIALPGGAGTRSEIQLAIEYDKPLIIFNPKGEWDEFKTSPAIFVRDISRAITEILRQAPP